MICLATDTTDNLILYLEVLRVIFEDPNGRKKVQQ